MRSTGGSQTGIHLMEKKQGQALDDWRERQTVCWRDPCTDSEPEKIISEVTCSLSSSSLPWRRYLKCSFGETIERVNN
jgi:hypothetical protein